MFLPFILLLKTQLYSRPAYVLSFELLNPKLDYLLYLTNKTRLWEQYDSLRILLEIHVLFVILYRIYEF